MLMKAEDMRGLGAGLLHRSALLPALAPGGADGRHPWKNEGPGTG